MSAPTHATATVPTTLMREGNFSELLAANGGPGYTIYDPTSLNCLTTTTCTRQAYPGNIIPTNAISPIAQAMQSFLPTPTTPGIQNNYLGGYPQGNDNWLYSGRIDYDISSKHRLSRRCRR